MDKWIDVNESLSTDDGRTYLVGYSVGYEILAWQKLPSEFVG